MVELSDVFVWLTGRQVALFVAAFETLLVEKVKNSACSEKVKNFASRKRAGVNQKEENVRKE